MASTFEFAREQISLALDIELVERESGIKIKDYKDLISVDGKPATVARLVYLIWPLVRDQIEALDMDREDFKLMLDCNQERLNGVITALANEVREHKAIAMQSKPAPRKEPSPWQ